MEEFNPGDFGFVVLCPERNYGGLKSTVRSIKNHFPDRPCLCVTVDGATAGEVAEFGSACKTCVGGTTYTSLINLGIRENPAAWSLVLMAGSHVRRGQLSRYERFCTNNRQVLYPVVDRKWAFYEATINGLFLHRNAIAEVGQFDEVEQDFELVRLLWATEAISQEYQFISLAGVPH